MEGVQELLRQTPACIQRAILQSAETKKSAASVRTDSVHSLLTEAEQAERAAKAPELRRTFRTWRTNCLTAS